MAEIFEHYQSQLPEMERRIRSAYTSKESSNAENEIHVYDVRRTYEAMFDHFHGELGEEDPEAAYHAEWITWVTFCSLSCYL